MSNPPSYSHRASLIGGERQFVAHSNRLACHEGGSLRQILYAEMRQIRITRMVASRHLPSHWRCIVTPQRGRGMTFTSLHMESGKAPIEDRAAAMQAFTAEFLQRAARKNPEIVFVSGKPLLMCLLWTVIYLALLGFIGLGAYIFVLTLLGTQAIVSNVLAFLIAAGLVVIAGISFLRWIRGNWPARFDPLAGAAQS